ncbi:nitroreductase/quinone reductase family protein [Amycolatopsis cynarae]|uniref:Nitroreductase/quinone reductase family protein n=1 Tax=Amycolatopsis cynarae TaxID=2995223 RepID=A0ABY7B7A7_9PSEU|nr:nitroreductase/quinone reductase family protein [Amycolatopsis sp. HUAS 11-8]WAL66638.1 nitroreductase/quinone reductase family protein [Amycolatopsis sp. HUAS 11-8]
MTTGNPTVPGFVNVVVRALLRTPAHRLLSRNTMLLSFAGRKTGKVYTIPVSYFREGEIITCYTDSGWWKNLRGGAPVSVSIAGRRFRGVGEVVTQEHQAAVESLRTFLAKTPRDAKYHGVTLAPNGDPDAGDLDRAARASTMIRIRLSPE